MSLSPQDWHRRFLQQAAWTRQLRQYLLGRLELTRASRILEVGCGTGVITTGLSEDTPAQVYGLDLNLAYLQLAQQNASAGRSVIGERSFSRRETGPFDDAPSSARYINGNALRLPFADESFHTAVCHFFLLWVPQASSVLGEMLRITQRGGAVIAFAEPDYGGRIDYPPALAEPGRLQADTLRQQGADPDMGRKLSGLFHAAGLGNIETGLLGAQWQGQTAQPEIDSEWETLEADLSGLLSAGRLQELRQVDKAARRSGQRVLFVPTFYAIGFKPTANNQ